MPRDLVCNVVLCLCEILETNTLIATIKIFFDYILSLKVNSNS